MSLPQTEPLGITGTDFYGLNTVPDSQPTVSKHSRELEVLTDNPPTENHVLRIKSINQLIFLVTIMNFNVKNDKYTATVSGKKWNHSVFVSNFAKCWSILKILSPTELAVNF